MLCPRATQYIHVHVHSMYMHRYMYMYMYMACTYDSTLQIAEPRYIATLKQLLRSSR